MEGVNLVFEVFEQVRNSHDAVVCLIPDSYTHLEQWNETTLSFVGEKRLAKRQPQYQTRRIEEFGFSQLEISLDYSPLQSPSLKHCISHFLYFKNSLFCFLEDKISLGGGILTEWTPSVHYFSWMEIKLYTR